MRCLIVISCILICVHSKAATDTLSVKEKQELRDALMQTPLGANFQAEAYSKKGDSAKAGEYLVKSDPHYLMFFGQTPQTLPEFLSRFKSTQDNKDRYIQAFTNAYNAPKSMYYTTFKKMYQEDQVLRNRSGNCNTKELCKQLDKQIRATDSIHAAYLYNYVSKNGWPAIDNGGLYAGILAVHDHKNHGFYIPHLKKAVREGYSPLDALEILYYYNSSESRSRESFETYLDTSQKFSFDVSSILNYRLPANMSEIRKIVDEHCPVEFHLVLYAYKEEIHTDWFNDAWARGNRDKEGHIIGQFFSYIKKNCSPPQPHMLYGNWFLHNLHSDTRRSKMVLYVLYK